MGRIYRTGKVLWNSQTTHPSCSLRIIIKSAGCNASSFEEPCAVIPHAGICEGAVGELAVLPRFRHPKAPGLSLAGVRLIIADHAKGLPVLRALPLCTCYRHYPGTATGATLRSFLQPYQPSPEWLPGRPVQCPFRGLLSVHSRYGLHTRWIAYSDSLHWRLQPLRYLHDCSNCFRLERFSRVGLSPTGKAPPYHGAHPKLTVDVYFER